MSSIIKTCKKAKAMAGYIAELSTADKDRLLHVIADALVVPANVKIILTANKKDIEKCTREVQFVDRLTLTPERIKGIAEGIREVAKLQDPTGAIIEERKLYNGLELSKVCVPLGVVGIIYEARPNVTADVIALTLKTGNAVVLRGSKDAYESNKAIAGVIKSAVRKAGFESDFIQLIKDTTRGGATEFMQARGLIDVLIPRGSAALIENVVLNSTVPVIETGAGNCHIYVDKCADVDMAIEVIINAKCQRPGVCNALETLLICKDIVSDFLPLAIERLQKAGVTVRGDKAVQKTFQWILEATEDDYYKEYGALEIAVKVVKDVGEAITHINKYGTKHSDAIVTKDEAAAKRFVSEVDSACVYINTSTRFSDGFEFGLGAEVGISTQKLHARGPMGLEALTSTKFVIKGTGQVRE